MMEDICTKPCTGPIISQINKWMTGLIFYPTSDTEHYQLMRSRGQNVIDTKKNSSTVVLLCSFLNISISNP